jgi:hypothetical protein
MSYYDTIDDDVKRAKEILKTGEGSGCNEYRPDHNGECQTCDEPADAHGDVSTAIYGADIYTAYKLLESFVAEITNFHQLFSDYEDPCTSYEQAFAIWQMMKARETKLHDEITRLRAEVAAGDRALAREQERRALGHD